MPNGNHFYRLDTSKLILIWLDFEHNILHILWFFIQQHRSICITVKSVEIVKNLHFPCAVCWQMLVFFFLLAIAYLLLETKHAHWNLLCSILAMEALWSIKLWQLHYDDIYIFLLLQNYTYQQHFAKWVACKLSLWTDKMMKYSVEYLINNTVPDIFYHILFLI